MLVSRRNEIGMTQRKLAERTNLSPSFVALLELDQRGRPEPSLSRTQIWNLVCELKIWPPACDRFLEAAGHESDRSAIEELDVQRELEFDELWVFARYPLDAEDAWFQVVHNNIVNRRIAYRYFIEEEIPFLNLLHRLKAKKVSEKVLESQLECIVVPNQFFVSNFALYLNTRERRATYCCGTKLHEGKAEKFYAMDSSEASRLFQMLRRWRDSLHHEQPIRLSALRRVHPTTGRSEFVPNTGL